LAGGRSEARTASQLTANWPSWRETGEKLPATNAATVAVRVTTTRGHDFAHVFQFAAGLMKVRLQEALNGMDPLDREVLALRHFEQLDNAETAQALDISPSGASSRYLRALKRLKDILREVPGFFEE